MRWRLPTPPKVVNQPITNVRVMFKFYHLVPTAIQVLRVKSGPSLADLNRECPYAVVVVPRGVDDHLSFLKAVEVLQTETLVL